EERAARAPPRALVEQSRARGDVLERPVAAIVVQPVLSVIRDVEVLVAVVVVVARAGALAPAAGSHARARRHVLESAVPAAAEEVVDRLLALREPFERGAVHEEDIEEAVAVVIEEGDSRARGLQEVAVRFLSPEHGRGAEARL